MIFSLIGIDSNLSVCLQVSSLSGDVQSRTNEMNREIRRKERTEREVKQLRGELEEKVKHDVKDLYFAKEVFRLSKET